MLVSVIIYYYLCCVNLNQIITNMGTKVVIYARVSTKNQDYDRQLSELREYASRMDYEVVQEFAEKINVCVPTGNFGNILACYIAKEMGLYIDKIVCASNENKVLTDFFNTYTYDKNRPFYITNSPAMDILISSNLERLLYIVTNQNEE